MSSQQADLSKGAKRRSGIPTRASPAAPLPPSVVGLPPRIPDNVQRVVIEDPGRDSGLSSECTTPTNGSPPPRQPSCDGDDNKQEDKEKESRHTLIPVRKTRMVDIIAASKARLQESERLNNRTTRLLNSRSSSESPRSLDGTARNLQYSSPLRPPRNLQSPSINSDDEGSVRMERGTYSYMFQDIVSIKTMLLKLKRVLQESGENGVTRTDPLNPFDNTLKNGLFYNLNDSGSNATTDASTSPNDGRDVVAADELADLRRQVVFLQGQVDDKDRLINSLQAQLEKYQNASNNGEVTNNSRGDVELCNAATQTDKLRPVSAGPSILQGLSQDNNSIGPLVSCNESWTHNNQHHQSQSHLHHQQQQQIPRPSGISTELSSPSSTRSSSRRSSSDSLSTPSPQQQQARPTSLRGLRLPNGHHHHHNHHQQHHATAVTPPDSPKNSATRTSSIPTPRRLATPTLIPRAARAVSATGRPHNS